MFRRIVRSQHRKARRLRLERERQARSFETACWYLLRERAVRDARSINRRRAFELLMWATLDALAESA